MWRRRDAQCEMYITRDVDEPMHQTGRSIDTKKDMWRKKI
jgi:hypothetical protein